MLYSCVTEAIKKFINSLGRLLNLFLGEVIVSVPDLLPQLGQLGDESVVGLVQGGDLPLLQQDHHLLVPHVPGHLQLVLAQDVLLLQQS